MKWIIKQIIHTSVLPLYSITKISGGKRHATVPKKIAKIFQHLWKILAFKCAFIMIWKRGKFQRFWIQVRASGFWLIYEQNLYITISFVQSPLRITVSMIASCWSLWRMGIKAEYALRMIFIQPKNYGNPCSVTIAQLYWVNRNYFLSR